MRLKRWEPKKARIEIIPMIDTIFFLLVFFMIASLAMTTMKGMPVNLPKSSTAGDRAVRTIITVTETGKYYIDKQLIAFEDIRPSLAGKLKENPDIGVIINCDTNQDWGKGVDVMDEARMAGVTNLTIATEPRSDD